MKSGIWLLSLAALAAAACGGENAAPAAPGQPPAAVSESGVGSLEWAVAGDWRLEREKARDRYRHPVETLKFFGLKPTDTVVELYPGGGWYTAILAPWLKQGGGKLYAAHVDPTVSEGAQANVDNYVAAFSNKDLYGDITITVASRNSPGIAPDGSADAVLTFRNIHNWMAQGQEDAMFKAFYDALKPGGYLGVEEHRAKTDQPQDPKAVSGYVREDYAQALAEKAGFKLVAKSEINANPKDTKDYPKGVWTLPPTFREGDVDRAKYEAIGESDRFTHLYQKPAK